MFISRLATKDTPLHTHVDHQVLIAEKEWLDGWKRGPKVLRWKKLPPQAGDRAPDLELRDAENTVVRLSHFWKSRPALLLFWRHFGCGCGIERAERLAKEHRGYVKAGANVVVIGQGEPERSELYSKKYRMKTPMLSDPTFQAYTAYGLLEGKPSQILYDSSDELLRCEYEAGVKLAEARRVMGRPLVDSPWQLPGEFVVDESGTIRLAYRYQYCENYPDPRVLLAAIREASGKL